MDSIAVWTVIIGIGIGSFALRFIFTGLIGDRPMPDWMLRHLRYTAVAVLPGLVAPLVVFPQATGGELDAPRLSAAVVTLALGYTTKRVILSIFCGAAVLYLGIYLTG